MLAEDEDDPKLERRIWTMTSCPDEVNCSKASWKKHQPWSFVSRERCFDYLAHHLQVSHFHQWHDVRIFLKILDIEQSAEIEEWTDTFADREIYRSAFKGTAVVPAKRQKLEDHRTPTQSTAILNSGFASAVREVVQDMLEGDASDSFGAVGLREAIPEPEPEHA